VSPPGQQAQGLGPGRVQAGIEGRKCPVTGQRCPAAARICRGLDSASWVLRTSRTATGHMSMLRVADDNQQGWIAVRSPYRSVAHHRRACRGLAIIGRAGYWNTPPPLTKKFWPVM